MGCGEVKGYHIDFYSTGRFIFIGTVKNDFLEVMLDFM